MATNDPPDVLIDALKSLNFRAARDALAAFFVHAHKSRLGPVETVEQLVEIIPFIVYVAKPPGGAVMAQRTSSRDKADLENSVSGE
jgi:hypothetical protein